MFDTVERVKQVIRQYYIMTKPLTVSPYLVWVFACLPFSGMSYMPPGTYVVLMHWAHSAFHISQLPC